MKKTLVLVAILIAAVGQAQIKMVVHIGGKSVGTASLTQKINKDGSKSVLLSMELDSEGTTVTLRSESSYTAKGMPIRKFEETYVESQKFRRQRIATFTETGADVVEDVNGKRKTTHVAISKTLPKADLTEFWFVRDKPKVGDSVQVYSFNLETMTWELVTTTYKGMQNLKIGGKTIKANRTDSDKGTAYLDEEGLPYRLDITNGNLERIGIK